MKHIEVEVAATGEVKIEAVGFKGNSCEQATKALEQALGATASKKKKPEYYNQNETTAQN
jgi:hypothetical protein